MRNFIFALFLVFGVSAGVLGCNEEPAEANPVADALAIYSVPECGVDNYTVEVGAFYSVNNSETGTYDGDSGPIFTGGVATGYKGVCFGGAIVHDQNTLVGVSPMPSTLEPSTNVATAVTIPLGTFAKLMVGVGTTWSDDTNDAFSRYTFLTQIRFGL